MNHIQISKKKGKSPMTFIDRIREHKETGLSKTIYLLIGLFILINAMYLEVININKIDYYGVIILISTLLITLIPLVAGFIFEKEKKIFTSHFILFAFFLNTYIPRIFNLNQRLDLVDYLFLILGLVLSLYSLLKMYIHKNELSNYIEKPTQQIMIVIIITLIKVFLDSSFNFTAVYILIYLAILLSSKEINALILSLLVYTTSLVNNLTMLFVNVNAPAAVYYNITLSIIINIIMIVFIFNIYRNRKSNDNIYYS